jgi:UTP--glucose-1-phosphate uridylyltransferase
MQVPREHEREFQSLKTFTCFNTNNLWASVKSIKELLATDSLQPPVIVTETAVGSLRVLELETAAGAAIEVRCAQRLLCVMGP